MDYLAFERRLLRLMFRSNAPLTPVHVAYYLDLSVAEAREHLDHMVTLGILELDSDREGHLVYNFPLRPALESLPDPRPVRQRRRRAKQMLTLVPTVTSTLATDLALAESRYYSPAAAAALSLFLPGVGQIYSGRIPQGIGWMLATGLGYILFLIPGLILHICCVVNAAAVPPRLPALAERIS
jgi:hypothetical protein